MGSEAAVASKVLAAMSRPVVVHARSPRSSLRMKTAREHKTTTTTTQPLYVHDGHVHTLTAAFDMIMKNEAPPDLVSTALIST